jgi:hypothetical protein
MSKGLLDRTAAGEQNYGSLLLGQFRDGALQIVKLAPAALAPRQARRPGALRAYPARQPPAAAAGQRVKL